MKDFTGFRYGNVHTKDLHLVVVTSSDRYEKNLLPSPKDYTTEVPGGDGSYYFGQTFDSREFTCNVAFDSVDEKTWRRISQLFSTDKLQDLVFDELPYKTYRAKLKSKPEFKFICFTNRDTGDRVYKGEGTLNFICYFPYAFGFNKYIVRAADYYNITPPETIIKTHSKEEHEYANNLIEPLDKHTKDFYNVKNNMETPWKGGYPTIEQVQAGELFFNTPDGEKSIIDVRGYWENVPEWAPSSKLLTTPTLDYDQELIYLPQYSKTNYINMDTGLTRKNAIIGSRLLVYNPGDVPIEFKMHFNANEKGFWTTRGNHFKIRRFNVQRLTIPQAVDWTGLRPQNKKDEELYKYGDKYFKRKEKEIYTQDGVRYYNLEYKELDQQHPNHAYIAEPIPRELLGNFIRTFYMQSYQIDPNINYEDGFRLADKYEELRGLCNREEEEYELYWKTLKDFLSVYKDKEIFSNDIIISALKVQDTSSNTEAYIYMKDNRVHYTTNLNEIPELLNGKIYSKKVFYKDKNKEEIYELVTNVADKRIYVNTIDSSSSKTDGNRIIFEDISTKKYYKLLVQDLLISPELGSDFYFNAGEASFDIQEEFLEFLHDYIHNPPEFVRKSNDANYGEVVFNIDHYPQWYTQDYLEITSDNMAKKNNLEDKNNITNQKNIPKYVDNEMDIRLDSEKRLLYSEYYNINESVYTFNGNYKPQKTIYNDNIKQGHWFRIPPGWSLIEVVPVCDEDLWGGKRWLDARPFKWGYGGINNGNTQYIQKVFDKVYDKAVDLYLSALGKDLETLTQERKDELMNFRKWYESEIEMYRNKDTFCYEYYRNKEVQLEYGFLRLLQDYWSIQEGLANDIKGDINEWWWYACNYIWANFPPLYWGLADILTDAKADYIPLFY